MVFRANIQQLCVAQRIVGNGVIVLSNKLRDHLVGITECRKIISYEFAAVCPNAYIKFHIFQFSRSMIIKYVQA